MSSKTLTIRDNLEASRFRSKGPIRGALGESFPGPAVSVQMIPSGMFPSDLDSGRRNGGGFASYAPWIEPGHEEYRF